MGEAASDRAAPSAPSASCKRHRTATSRAPPACTDSLRASAGSPSPRRRPHRPPGQIVLRPHHLPAPARSLQRSFLPFPAAHESSPPSALRRDTAPLLRYTLEPSAPAATRACPEPRESSAYRCQSSRCPQTASTTTPHRSHPASNRQRLQYLRRYYLQFSRDLPPTR